MKYDLLSSQKDFIAFCKHIQESKQSILIMSEITADFKIPLSQHRWISFSDLLNDQAKKGVRIKIIYGEKNSYQLFITKLLKSIRYRFCPRNHAKIIVVDNKIAYVGSANISGSGIGQSIKYGSNFELGIITSDSHLLARIRAFFEYRWDKKDCQYCKYKNKCPSFL